LDALIYATCRGGPGGVLGVPTTQAGSAYAVLVAPLASNMGAWFRNPLTRSSAVLLVHDPLSRSRHAVEILQSALGLRPGAAKLAAALAGDDDLQSYAERERISINTVRFHLRSALAQTQTRTQAELVGVVVRLLRDIALGAES
jgi:DNA-binding CsgD family transcriptional regulator